MIRPLKRPPVLMFICHRCAREMSINEFLTLAQSREEPCFNCQRVFYPRESGGGFIWGKLLVEPQSNLPIGEIALTRSSDIFPVKLTDGSIIHGYMIGSAGDVILIVEKPRSAP